MTRFDPEMDYWFPLTISEAWDARVGTISRHPRSCISVGDYFRDMEEAVGSNPTTITVVQGSDLVIDSVEEAEMCSGRHT